MKPRRCLVFLSFLALATIAQATGIPPAPSPTANVIVVTLDGLRWQEFFGGADRALLKEVDKAEPPAPVRRFWRETPEARRAALMPFMWEVVARQGQVFGDPSQGSLAHVANGLWFSYPGYAEMLSGFADPRVNSNDKVPNPNPTVLEWLNGQRGFAGRVFAFGAWDVLPSILAVGRSGLPAGDGYPPVPGPATERDRAINDLADDLPPLWDGAPLDAPIMQAALECLRARQPRVLYVMLGETDEWGHEGRYDLYLDAAWRGDRFIRRIWEAAQSMPAYAGKTALVVAVDHGRGATPEDWTDHGEKVPAAERILMAVMGPDTPALGLRKSVTVTAGQLAATAAALVGEDFNAAAPKAAPPLPLR
ncbi:MAG: Type phosphodiesterase / nucleotide pyrophosphatase [Acidobacteria bacterium]|nr:Type phosphodiesterase / nucleotide pyrophosphatase [Acidobacteriota bacterium]